MALCGTCSSLRCGTCGEGCGLCISKCCNCETEVCDNCLYNCSLCGGQSENYCQTCITIANKCVSTNCTNRIDLIFLCVECIADSLDDGSSFCDICKSMNVLLDQDRNTDKGYDSCMVFGGTVNDHIKLRACFRMLHTNKEMGMYAPGGKGFEQAAKRVKHNGFGD